MLEIEMPDSKPLERSIDAVVLAGKSPLLDLDTDYKALLELEGTPLVVYVINTLLNSKYINKIHIIGEKEIRKLEAVQQPRANFVMAKQSFYENLYERAKSAETENILFSTSDIPLINEIHVDTFIEKCISRGKADFYVSYCTREEDFKKYPEIKCGYPLVLDSNEVRNGCIFMANKQFMKWLLENSDFKNIINDLYAGRKKALMPYIRPAIRYNLLSIIPGIISKRVTLQGIETLISKKLGYEIRGIKADSECGIDIDDKDDFEKIKCYKEKLHKK